MLISNSKQQEAKSQEAGKKKYNTRQLASHFAPSSPWALIVKKHFSKGCHQ
jgi:hypothetical protein